MSVHILKMLHDRPINNFMKNISLYISDETSLVIQKPNIKKLAIRNLNIKSPERKISIT
jgi:hypothetical protein